MKNQIFRYFLTVVVLFSASKILNAQEVFNIYIYDTKKGEAYQATFLDSTSEFNANFSPNGNYILHDGINGNIHDLYITDLKTGESEKLSGAEGGNDAIWSSNGKFIVYDRDPSGLGLYYIDSEGGVPTLITPSGRDGYPLPNNKTVIYHNFNTGTINKIGLDGNGDTALFQGYDPVVSKNGRMIAYLNQGQIFTAQIDNDGNLLGAPEQETNFVDQFPSKPSWSVNGKEIIFHLNDQNFRFDIYELSLKSGEIKKLVGNTNNNDFDPAYSKDGRLIAYSSSTLANYFDSNKAKILSNQSLGKTESVSTENHFSLSAHPNPFNPSTNIQFVLPQEQFVDLKIYNMMGREVASLLSESMNEGAHKVRFDASGLSSGTYLYRLKAGNKVITKKFILIK